LWSKQLLRRAAAAKEGSVIRERINQIAETLKRFGKEEPVVISDYLDEELVCFLEANSQQQALSTLIDKLDEQGKLSDKKTFFQAILEREKIISTGIGIGVAIPHAKLSGYTDFFIAIGIQKKGGIEWNSIDGLPVKLIFMIGGPDNRQTEYLNILSMITTAIKNEERRKRLMSAKSAHDVIAIFKTGES
jgi:PTS system nitrogen regulatory IIA component